MGTSVIRFSCFKKLTAFTKTPLSTLFPNIPVRYLNVQTDDYFILLTLEELNQIYAILGKIEDERIAHSIYQSKKAVNELKKTSFRQTRNAFGAAAGWYGAMSLFLMNAVCWGIVANAILLIIPTILLGGLVYRRGKREEKQINQDIEADWFDKIISIHLKYEKLKKLRLQTERLLPHSRRPFLQPHKNERIIKIKSYKEKRHPIANPLSHFVFPALTMMGLCYSSVKMGLLGSAIVAGGPVCWGIAIGLGCLTGGYFCYKRYRFLQKKIIVENNFSRLAVQENKLDREIDYLENQISRVGSYRRMFTQFIPRQLNVVKNVVDYAKASIKQITTIFDGAALHYQPAEINREHRFLCHP